jgi:putative N-acetylmannosamine-6-phosphate epimerase
MKNLILTLLLLPLAASAQIKTSYDEFSGSFTHSTPYFTKMGYMSEAITGILSIDSSQDRRYFLSMRTFSASITGGINKGGYILFADGEKLSFTDADVEYDYDANVISYTASCFTEIDEDDIKSIANKPIKAVKVYIHSRYLTPKEQARIMSNFKLLLSK